MSDIADILDRAADMIEPEGAWTQRCWKQFGARCLASAVSQAGQRDCSPYLAAMGFRGLWDAVSWNDTHGRTQAEVVARLREAAARARGQS